MSRINEKIAVKAILFSIVGNTLLAIIKLFSGIIGCSYALIADAIESTADIFSSGLVLLGLKYSNKNADENHPYGHGRAEPLITFLTVGFLMASAALIAHESIINIRTPHEAPKAWTLFILGSIIIWKEYSYRLVLKRSKETGSSSLKADAWHHRADSVTSISAFIGISISLILGKGYESADDWGALFAAAFILYNCYHIFRPALGEIMDEHTHHDLLDEVKKASHIDGIVDLEKCFIRKSGMKYHVDIHAWVDGDISVTEGHKLSHKLKDNLHKEIPQLGHIMIHIEPAKK